MKNKKVFSLVLSLLMIITILPFNVFAKEDSDTSSPVTTDTRAPQNDPAAAEYTVNFDLDGGKLNDSTTVAPATVNEGEQVANPGDPTKEGYTFNGWYNTDTKYDFSQPVNENLTLVAKWSENVEKFEVSFDTKTDKIVATQIIVKGSTADKPEDPTRDGYRFVAWQLNGSNYDFSTPVTKNINLVAKWEKVAEEEFTVTFDSNGGKPTFGDQTIKKGKKVVKPADPVKEGYVFKYWVNKADMSKYDFNAKVTSNLNLKAIYAVKTINKAPVISGVKVYRDRVTGYTDYSNTKVTLYRNGVSLGSYRTDLNGFFRIDHKFHDGIYNDGYGRHRIYPLSYKIGHTSLNGYTSSNTYVVAYDRHGNFLDSTTSDRDGYYSLSYRYVSDVDGIRVYRGYDRDYNYNGYHNLSDYYLVATKDDFTSSRYYLSSANVSGYWNDSWHDGYWNSGYWYDGHWYSNGKYYDYAKYARLTSFEPGNKYVKGYGVNAYSDITIKDSLGYKLGTATANSSGNFTVNLNRELRSGETIDVIVSHRNYRDAKNSFTVSGKKEVSSYNYKAVLTIGSALLEKTIDGKSYNTYMDIAPFIKEGRTMLPIRYVAEALGYKVTWNNISKVATLMDNENIVLINTNSNTFYVNGVAKTFVVGPEIKDNRTVLPISEVARALGLTQGNLGDKKNVEWDSVNHKVYIELKK